MTTNQDQETKFELAAEKARTISNVPDTTKLKLYGLFKQATVGKNLNPRPSIFALTARAKHDAWAELDSMNKEQAMEQYIVLVEGL